MVLNCSNFFSKFMFLIYMLKMIGLVSKNDVTSFTVKVF